MDSRLTGCRIAGMGDVLTGRELNRATLARQLLLRRVPMPALDAVRHLVGMQAQVPSNPYVGLYARLDGFGTDELSQLVLNRRVVRIVAMRATLHLLTANDCMVLRALCQPVLDAELARHREFAPALRGVDLDEVMAFARPLLGERPHSGGELRAAMAERFPGEDAAALAYACRCLLPLVQVPPRGVWGKSAQVVYTTAESWLARPAWPERRDRPEAATTIDAVVLRYLAAFGPATVADVAAWCRLTGMREVVERLRPRLRTFRDESGRELFDVPEGPRPDPDTPAPPRLLPEYDNVLLSHADRSRFGDDDRRRRLMGAPGRYMGTLLVDGMAAGSWELAVGKDDGRATLIVRNLGTLGADRAAVEDEAAQLVRFLEASASAHEVRLEPIA